MELAVAENKEQRGKGRVGHGRGRRVTTLLMICADVTERRATEAALRRSEERYRSAIAALDEGIVLQDASGAIQACNASAERILGLTSAAMAGRRAAIPAGGPSTRTAPRSTATCTPPS